MLCRARHPVAAMREIIQPEHDRRTDQRIDHADEQEFWRACGRLSHAACSSHALLGFPHQIDRTVLGFQIGFGQILTKNTHAEQLHTAAQKR